MQQRCFETLRSILRMSCSMQPQNSKVLLGGSICHICCFNNVSMSMPFSSSWEFNKLASKSRKWNAFSHYQWPFYNGLSEHSANFCWWNSGINILSRFQEHLHVIDEFGWIHRVVQILDSVLIQLPRKIIFNWSVWYLQHITQTQWIFRTDPKNSFPNFLPENCLQTT